MVVTVCRKQLCGWKEVLCDGGKHVEIEINKKCLWDNLLLKLSKDKCICQVEYYGICIYARRDRKLTCMGNIKWKVHRKNSKAGDVSSVNNASMCFSCRRELHFSNNSLPASPRNSLHSSNTWSDYVKNIWHNFTGHPIIPLKKWMQNPASYLCEEKNTAGVLAVLTDGIKLALWRTQECQGSSWLLV